MITINKVLSTMISDPNLILIILTVLFYYSNVDVTSEANYFTALPFRLSCTTSQVLTDISVSIIHFVCAQSRITKFLHNIVEA